MRSQCSQKTRKGIREYPASFYSAFANQILCNEKSALDFDIWYDVVFSMILRHASRYLQKTVHNTTASDRSAMTLSSYRVSWPLKMTTRRNKIAQTAYGVILCRMHGLQFALSCTINNAIDLPLTSSQFLLKDYNTINRELHLLFICSPLS